MTLDVILNSATSASLLVRRQYDSGHQRIASRSLKNLHLRLDSCANSLAFERGTPRAVLNETETEAKTGTETNSRKRVQTQSKGAQRAWAWKLTRSLATDKVEGSAKAHASAAATMNVH